MRHEPEVSILTRTCAPSLLRVTACGAMLASGMITACADEPKADALSGVTLVREDPGGRPLAKLPEEWLTRFKTGDALFDQTYLDSQGLGPVFIRSSCGSCHEDDGRGPGAVRKMVLIDDDGAPLADQSALPFGNTVRPQTAAGVSQGITVPEDGKKLLVSTRMPAAVFGRGYMEAVSDSEILRVEAAQAEREDGISGRINWVKYTSNRNTESRFATHDKGETLIGRFGLKARVASLDDFTADAMQGDMGMTSDMRPNELPNPAGEMDDLPGVDLAPDSINFISDYMRMLRIPNRKPDDPKGAALFEQAQCGACHVPTLHTDPEYAMPLLADIDAPIYTDLLLHDMGPGFSDGLSDQSAKPSEWRTAPLLGMRFMRTYLHDGRAATLEEAIELHGADGSEAADSVRRFQTLDDASRAQLLAFVAAL
jgi:CxxC motif-containing protein (DUF1111 family)